MSIKNGTYRIRSVAKADFNLLSTNKEGTNIDLYNTDDTSGRQKWIIKNSSTFNGKETYNILVSGGTNAGEKFLSIKLGTKSVDLYDKDDGTGHQKWIIEKIPGKNYYSIKISLKESGLYKKYIYLGANKLTKGVDLNISVSTLESWYLEEIKESVGNSEEGTGGLTRTEGSTTTEILSEFSNIDEGVYNIRVSGKEGKNYLSTTSDGVKVDLIDSDDGSGRQQWFIKKEGLDNGDPYYSIKVFMGNSSDRIYLSTALDSSVVDLWSSCESSSKRQFWKFRNIPGTDLLSIENIGDKENKVKDRIYLSSTEKTDIVDLWSMVDESGRQEWFLEPVKDVILRLESVVWDLSEYDNLDLDHDPRFEKSVIYSKVISNNSSTKIKDQINIEESVENRSSFSLSNSLTIGSETFLEYQAGVPKISNTTASMKLNISRTVKSEKTVEEKQTSKLRNMSEVIVNPHSSVVVSAMIIKGYVSIPFKATVIYKNHDKLEIDGKWEGDVGSNIYINVSDDKMDFDLVKLLNSRYVLNTNTNEVHDLRNIKKNCRISEIIQAGHAKFYGSETLPAKSEMNYDECSWCFDS